MAALFGLFACAEEAAPDRPNVILFVIDTLRADHVSAYGYERETTPTIDRLSDAGVRFDAAIAHSSWSAPSHASIMTGALPHEHGVARWGDTLAAETPTLAVHLKRSLYATGLFSTHSTFHGATKGVLHGFDVVSILDPKQDEPVLIRATQWAAKQTEPFLLCAVIMTPHAPYLRYPPALDERFTDIPPGGERTYPFSSEKWIGPGHIPLSVRLGDRADVGYYVNRYDRSVLHADDLLGAFLERLEAAGKLEDTLVVVTSDHGEGLGDHDTFAHEVELFDFLVRVPLVVSYPGVIAPGRIWREQVGLVDIVPTILGLTHAPDPTGLAGRNLAPHLLAGSSPPDDRFALGSYRMRGYDRFMVRSTRYKLIHDAKEGTQELYELATDPLEERNLLEGELEPAAERAYFAHQTELSRLLALTASDPSERPPNPLPDEVVEQLRELGYVER